jgi:hypothetical protein
VQEVGISKQQETHASRNQHGGRLGTDDAMGEAPVTSSQCKLVSTSRGMEYEKEKRVSAQRRRSEYI